jgi:O-antigen ligase
MGINVLFSIYQFLILKIQAVSIFHNPIYFAYVEFMAFAYCFILINRNINARKIRYELPLLLAISFLGLISANNRMTILVAVIALFYLLIKKIFLNPKQLSIYLFIILIPICLLGGFLFNPWVNDKIVRTTWFLSDSSIKTRVQLWQYNLNLILENIFFGVGPNNNSVRSEVKAEFINLLKPGYDIYAHNVIIQALAEWGVIGMGFIASFFYFLAKKKLSFKLYVLLFLVVGLSENILQNAKPSSAFIFFGILILFNDKLEMKVK